MRIQKKARKEVRFEGRKVEYLKRKGISQFLNKMFIKI